MPPKGVCARVHVHQEVTALVCIRAPRTPGIACQRAFHGPGWDRQAMWVTNGAMAVGLVPPGLTSFVPMAVGALLAPYLEGVKNSCSPNPEKEGEAVSQHIKGVKTQGLRSPFLPPHPGWEQESDKRAQGAQSRWDGAGDLPSSLATAPPCPRRRAEPQGLDPSWPGAEAGFPAHGHPQPLLVIVKVP